MIDPGLVIAQIEDAFDGVTLGDGISLNECEYNDSGGFAENYLRLAELDERVDWRKLVTDDLTNFPVTFSFTDVRGYRFYLPPYMIWTVKNHHKSDATIRDFTVFALDPTKHQFKDHPFADVFDRRQVGAILLFLEYCVENEATLDADNARVNVTRIRELLGADEPPP